MLLILQRSTKFETILLSTSMFKSKFFHVIIKSTRNLLIVRQNSFFKTSSNHLKFFKNFVLMKCQQ